MAYYPDIPQAEDEIRDSQPYILANFQELEGLANEKDNILEVSELAPYKNMIADSRIVEHNLDVSNPSNGYYVRWNNGLQVCWISEILFENVVAGWLQEDVTLPVEFRNNDDEYAVTITPYSPLTYNETSLSNNEWWKIAWTYRHMEGKDEIRIQVRAEQDFSDGESIKAILKVEGRWK